MDEKIEEIKTTLWKNRWIKSINKTKEWKWIYLIIFEQIIQKRRKKGGESLKEIRRVK